MTQSSWAEYSIHAPTYSRDEYYFKKNCIPIHPLLLLIQNYNIDRTFGCTLIGQKCKVFEP